MFDPLQKSTKLRSITPAGLLAVTGLVTSAVLVVAHSFGHGFISIATASSAICWSLAWAMSCSRPQPVMATEMAK